MMWRRGSDRRYRAKLRGFWYVVERVKAGWFARPVGSFSGPPAGPYRSRGEAVKWCEGEAGKHVLPG